MNLRDTLFNFYNLLSNKKDKIFMFFIGSYPARKESNHELPKIYHNLLKKNVPIYRLYIDPEYTEENNTELINRLGKDFLIYNQSISNYEYRMISEFCHIAGISGNSLCIIMEFTGLPRREQYMLDNMSDYLYISPTDCLADTNDPLYNPIIEQKKNGKYGFFHPEKIEFLSNEIVAIFQANIQEKNLEKLELLRDTIKVRLNDVEEIYRLLFNYMDRKDIFDVNHEINFVKEKVFFYASIDLLKMRMGYNKVKTEEIIDRFYKDSEQDFEIYVKQKIQNIFTDCLILESNGDEICVSNKYESIIFETPQDVYKICQRFKALFKDAKDVKVI